jgi:broad specificity phosphatase PhoE
MHAQRETAAEAYLIRHGETEWSLDGRHTGTTDIPLTENGRSEARRLAAAFREVDFSLVLTSPLQRARETCELAGLGDRAELDPDLKEWNYGAYEGLRPAEIRRIAPGWMVFSDGCPGGEGPDEVGARVDRLIARVRSMGGRVALFGHGHVFRVFAARWIGLPAREGARFLLGTSTLCILSDYRGTPAVKCWNAPVGAGQREREPLGSSSRRVR